jgi:hypothetical protein
MISIRYNNIGFVSYYTIGLGIVTFSDPPSGSVVANFKGTINATTLTCNVSNNGHQIASIWTVKDFRNTSGHDVVTRVAPDLFHVDGDPDSFVDTPRENFDNRLTILNFTSELDGMILYCGTKANPDEANFTLRLYRTLYSIELSVRAKIPIHKDDGALAP